MGCIDTGVTRMGSHIIEILEVIKILVKKGI